MTARNAMIHRASIERSTLSDPFDTFGATFSEDDVYGGDPLSLNWADHELHWGSIQLDWGATSDTLLHCYVQPKQESTITDTGRYFVHAGYRMLAPLTADLEEEDRVTEVTDRRGDVLFGDTLRVTALIRRETHLEAVLEG